MSTSSNFKTNFSNFSRSTKSGVASLYVVLFATILFGIITLSFVRIMLSETSQTGNDDLSQSAYDSALAGVEDAKIAVNQYYQCMNSNTAECQRLNAMPLFDGDCEDFYLREYLGYASSGEVKVEESISNDTDQAYTCVIVSNKVSDYRSTLTSDTPTRVVPVGIGAATLSDVKTISLNWYSETNGTDFYNLAGGNDQTLPNKNNATTPPTIALTLIVTNPSFSLDEFNNSTNGTFSTMLLKPSTSSSYYNNRTGTNQISWSTILNAGNSTTANSPFTIQCEHKEFACNVDLTNLALPAGGNAVLVVSMPYGNSVTDFALTLKKNDGSIVDFENVQVSVDATGRANQLLRRVETRLDPADLFFPYPEYEVQLDGSDANSLLKSFWITANCWTEAGTCDNNGQI